MVTLSDQYGDLTLEDLEEFENIEPENIHDPIDFDDQFDRDEVRSFEEDFGDVLDETLARLDVEDPEWSDEFIAEVDRQEVFEKNFEREAE